MKRRPDTKPAKCGWYTTWRNKYTNLYWLCSTIPVRALSKDKFLFVDHFAPHQGQLTEGVVLRVASTKKFPSSRRNPHNITTSPYTMAIRTSFLYSRSLENFVRCDRKERVIIQSISPTEVESGKVKAIPVRRSTAVVKCVC